jgi:hypothetical protein
MNRPAPYAKAAAAARELAEALAEIARDSERATGPTDSYDSAHLPPRTTRRRFAEICRSGHVEGAVQDGRIWVCKREAWHTARTRRKNPAAPSNPSLTPEQRVDALLSRRGLRLIDQPGTLPGSRRSG